MILLRRFVPDLIVMAAGAAALWLLGRWARQFTASRPRAAVAGTLALWMSFGILAAGFFTTLLAWADSPFGHRWMMVRGVAFALGLSVCGMAAIAGLLRRSRGPGALPPNAPVRREFLRTALSAALVASPAAVMGFGILSGRRRFRLTEVDLPIPDLPADLDGLRLVQLSDIHLSPFLSRAELARCVDIANTTRAHIALVTGDLVTGVRDSVDDCLEELKRLRSDAGTYGCLGNHEVYIHGEAYVAAEAAKSGMRFLRQQNTSLRFGSAYLNLAGVDFQPRRKTYLREAAALRREGQFNLLLSHNPDVFPVAAAQGWNLTVAGHTHGGQLNVEIMRHNLNLARLVTPYVYGAYREGNAAIYVTRGIGTISVPARIGADPEVALLRLRRT